MVWWQQKRCSVGGGHDGDRMIMTTTVLAMLLVMATKVTVVAVGIETSGSSSHFIVEVQNTVQR